MSNTTATLTTIHHNLLDACSTLTVEGDHTGYTISFDDLDAALADVEKAKAASWSAYLRSGGNPRNKRSHGSQYAAIKKALVKAAG